MTSYQVGLWFNIPGDSPEEAVQEVIQNIAKEGLGGWIYRVSYDDVVEYYDSDSRIVTDEDISEILSAHDNDDDETNSESQQEYEDRMDDMIYLGETEPPDMDDATTEAEEEEALRFAQELMTEIDNPDNSGTQGA